MKICIKDGLVIDPANKICAPLNLLMENGKITALTMEEPKADETIDAAGKVVVPGLIDCHIHEDPIDVKSGRILHNITTHMLQMGVTTVIGGNCGINASDPDRYLDLVDRDGAPVNIGLLAGHTYMREQAGAADKYGKITAEQKKKLKEIAKKYLDAGCMGVSYGIRYVPGMDEKEITATARLCKKGDKLIAAHIRDDADYVFDAVEEFLEIAKKIGLSAQISHLGSMAGYGQMQDVLRQLDWYRSNGLRVMSDCYPYSAFSTRIGETTYDEGFLERYDCDYSCIEVCEGKYKGMRCTREIFDELRNEAPETITVAHVMKPEDVEMALQHPNVCLASDGLLDGDQGHPRACGTFPRLISEYVKQGKVSLYQAIEKMTSMPAEKFGLTGKGRLNAGADADVLVFDFGKMKDRATFQNPTLVPVGISYVFVGGELAYGKGELKNTALGRSVRR